MLSKIWLGICFFASALAWGLQVGPEDAYSNASKWYRWFAEPPAWLTRRSVDDIASWFFAAIAVGALGTLLVFRRRSGANQPPTSAAIRNDADEMLPLKEAVGIAFDATKATAFGGFITGYGSSEPEIVYSYFTEMLEEGIPVYGRQPPGRNLDRLELFDPHVETLVDLSSVKPHHQPARIVELHVKRGDVERFVQAVRARDMHGNESLTR